MKDLYKDIIMYAIVEIAGQQFKVEKKQEIFVHRLEEKEGAKVEFSDVMLIDNNGTVSIGTPTINGAVVSAKVLEHLKGDKVLVFKKKRRKGYQKLNGHRQQFTKIQISDILENVPKAAAKKEDKEATVADEKPEAKKAVKKPAPKKKTAAGKEPKPAAKKEAKAAPKAKKPAAKAETKKAAPAKKAKPKAAPKAKKADEEKKEDK